MRIDPADILLCAEDPRADDTAPQPTSPPIVQTSLFSFPNFEALLHGFANEKTVPVYSRGTNPTVRAVEDKIAALERGDACLCLGSGMAAVSAVMLGLLSAGDHILFVNQTYGPSLNLARHLKRFGIEHDVVLELSPDAVRAALRPQTRLVWMESPGTMLFRVLDVEAVAGVAREHGAVSCMDNSWATPLLQKPIEMGVDVVVHSATKYLGGHSDLVAGAVVAARARVDELWTRAFVLNGGILGPFDAWLLLRGIRTLPVRLRQQGTDALAVATFLRGHPAVRRVRHPAFDENPALVERQLRGFSSLFSFELIRDDFATVAGVIDRLRHFRLGVSWGGYESLALTPMRSADAPHVSPMGIPRGLIRLSVGLEGADVLIEDLTQALEGVA